jgi:uncharacterized protein involved in exopolysaccharide biosynthesis
MNPSDNRYEKENQEEQFDFLYFIKTIWINRKRLYLITSLFLLTGIVYLLLSEKEYTAKSIFIPQTSESPNALGNISGLAAIAGINLGDLMSGSEFPPALYPKIVNSAAFRLELLSSPITIDGESMTYSQYYEDFKKPGLLFYFKKYTIKLPSTINSAIKKIKNDKSISVHNKFIVITEEQLEHFKRLEEQIKVKPNQAEGFVELSFTMQDPLAAAEMAKYTEELLQKEVIEYKIQNTREQLKFTEERFNEKKIEFEIAQNKLASSRDANQNINSAVAMNQLQKLEAEYNLAFSIYMELAKQLEQAKLQVSKDTPIFSAIEAVSIPTEKSAPKSLFVLLVFSFLGIFFSVVVIFLRNYLVKIIYN